MVDNKLFLLYLGMGQKNILSKVVGDSDCISQITGSGRLLRPIRYSSSFGVA